MSDLQTKLLEDMRISGRGTDRSYRYLIQALEENDAEKIEFWAESLQFWAKELARLAEVNVRPR